MGAETEDPKYGKSFTEVENEHKEALTDLEETYGGMISGADQYYKEQIQGVKDYADKQTELQQEKTDFAIEQIEQQKEQTRKDYIKEQSGAYVDWQKQSNQYGVNAEQMAASGLTNTGYSESSQVSMYNTYQNRITAAREAYGRAVLNYDNAIKDAQLQNNSILAEIAYKALQQQLELSLAGFQYKNQLILDKVGKKIELDRDYNTRYQQVLAQINQEEQFEIQREALNPQSVIYNSTGDSYNSTGDSERKGKTGSVAKDVSPAEIVKANKEKLLSQLGRNTNTYDKVIAFMNENGISDGGQRLLTGDEWSEAKNDGQKGSEFEYSSYMEYLDHYLRWRISEM